MNYQYILQSLLRNRYFKLFSASIFIILIVVLIFNLFINSSKIEISVEGQPEGDISYKISSQSSEDKIEKTSTLQSVKVRVKKDAYEISINNSEKSSFSVIKTKGFLRTTKVTATLAPEKSREFVGNDPKPCTYYDGALLYSYECNSLYKYGEVHEPANANTPTTTRDAPLDTNSPDLNNEGIIKYNGESTVVARQGDTDELDDSGVTINRLNPDFSLTNRRLLGQVDKTKTQKVLTYKQGFLVYDQQLENIHYYDSNLKHEDINIEGPGEKNLNAQNLSVDKSRIAAIYGSVNRATEGEDGGRGETKGEQTYVAINEEGKTRKYYFDGSYSIVQLCAQKYLCLVQNRKMEVYDVSSAKPKKKFEVQNVYNLINSSQDNYVTIFRYDGLINMDFSKQQGHYDLTLDKYTPCGIQKTEDNYTVCVINPAGDRSTLYIDTNKDNDDSINKKILNLYGQPFISDLSIYKNFIYISPEVGQTVYDSRTDRFVVDPELVKDSSDKISAFLKKSGVDVSKYSISVDSE